VVVTPAGGGSIEGGGVILPGVPVDGTVMAEDTFLSRSPNIYIREETPTNESGTNSSTNITKNVNIKVVNTDLSKDSLLNLNTGTNIPKRVNKDKTDC
jgi:hypothetical protein